MPNAAVSTSLNYMAPLRKNSARVALFELPSVANTLLCDCFRQFGIETIAVKRQEEERFRREKFDACVLPLAAGVEPLIETARSSASNSRTIIYGLGGSAQDSMRYSKYCINAVFHEPLERSAALKLVRSTRALVMHEHRRYVRIPLMTEVSIVAADGTRFTATSHDLSSGGMSLRSNFSPEPGMPLEVSFTLLTLPRIWVRAFASWKKTNKCFGIRFDGNDERRRRLKEWIDGYLES